jgi:hypothetical protein
MWLEGGREVPNENKKQCSLEETEALQTDTFNSTLFYVFSLEYYYSRSQTSSKGSAQNV